jgi:FtsZ-binding cell division protein ZapB
VDNKEDLALKVSILALNLEAFQIKQIKVNEKNIAILESLALSCDVSTKIIAQLNDRIGERDVKIKNLEQDINELRGKNKTLQNDYWALEDDVRQLERYNDYSQN